MAKTVEEILQNQLGGQALLIAKLLAENEALKEELKNHPVPGHEKEK